MWLCFHFRDFEAESDIRSWFDLEVEEVYLVDIGDVVQVRAVLLAERRGYSKSKVDQNKL